MPLYRIIELRSDDRQVRQRVCERNGIYKHPTSTARK